MVNETYKHLHELLRKGMDTSSLFSVLRSRLEYHCMDGEVIVHEKGNIYRVHYCWNYRYDELEENMRHINGSYVYLLGMEPKGYELFLPREYAMTVFERPQSLWNKKTLEVEIPEWYKVYAKSVAEDPSKPYEECVEFFEIEVPDDLFDRDPLTNPEVI